jgi:hypothetical protein
MKKTRYLIYLLILIVSITCSSRAISSNAVESSVDVDNLVNEYLLTNYSRIFFQGADDFTDLSIMDSDLAGKEMFLTAEHHAIKANAQLRIKFLRYFKEKANIKYYLAEYPYSMTHFINKYLETGDTKILKEIYRPLKGTYGWNKDDYDFWTELYEYNQEFAEEEKIQVIGIDIEHQLIEAYRFLVDVLPEQEAPEAIKDILARIVLAFDNYKAAHSPQEWRILTKLAGELHKDIAEKEGIYQDYLGDRFLGFRLVNQNMLYRAEAYEGMHSDEEFNNIRDWMMYCNFQIIHDSLPKGKYYGQWGLNHTFQSKEKDIKWLASYLNDVGSFFRNKTISIVYLYDDCGQMQSGNYAVEEINTMIPQIKKANDFVGGYVTIYRLNEEGSPFFEIPMQCTYTTEMLEKKVTDFYQYIVCIKGSEATEPLNDTY